MVEYRLDSACCHCAPHRGQPIWAAPAAFAPRQGILRPSRRAARWLISRQGILDSYRSSLKERPKEQADSETAAADDETCTEECVHEINTATEFDKIVQESNPETLLVIDFYRTACGSCRYIQSGFKKLCKGSHDDHAPVEFYKHNIIDEYDEETDLAERLKIKAVPLFQFYKGGLLLEEFATREKKRIGSAINHHCGQEVIHSAALHK